MTDGLFLCRKESDLDRNRRVIGLTIIVMSVLALIVWEKWGRVHFVYQDTLVLKENVERGTLVEESMLKVIKTGDAAKDSLGPEDAKWLVGKESGQFVHKNTQLFREYFRDRGLAVSEKMDRYMLKIAEAWIESAPQSLKTGDLAVFYANGKEITRARVSEISADNKSFEVAVSRKQAHRTRMSGNRKERPVRG